MGEMRLSALYPLSPQLINDVFTDLVFVRFVCSLPTKPDSVKDGRDATSDKMGE